MKPPRPLVLYQLVLEAVVLGHARDDVLKRWGQVVFQEPELDRTVRVLQDADHHDPAHVRDIALIINHISRNINNADIFKRVIFVARYSS